MQLGLETQDADAIASRPQPRAAVLEHGLAVTVRRFTQHRFGIKLALIDRQARTRLVSIFRRRIGTLRSMHPVHLIDPGR